METNEEECEKCETAELSQETDNATSLQERGKGFQYEVEKCWRYVRFEVSLTDCEEYCFLGCDTVQSD